MDKDRPTVRQCVNFFHALTGSAFLADENIEDSRARKTNSEYSARLLGVRACLYCYVDWVD